MPERFSRELAQKMGYTPISEAVQEAETARLSARTETVLDLLVGEEIAGTNTLDLIVGLHTELLQKPEHSPTDKTMMRVIKRLLLVNLLDTGMVLIGYDIQKGVETLPYDPKTQELFGEELEVGEGVLVVSPGLMRRKDGMLIKRPSVKKITGKTA